GRAASAAGEPAEHLDRTPDRRREAHAGADPYEPLVTSRRGEDQARRDADPVGERGPKQGKPVDLAGQLEPEHDAAPRTGEPRSAREGVDDRIAETLEVRRELLAHAAEVPVVQAFGQIAGDDVLLQRGRRD